MYIVQDQGTKIQTYCQNIIKTNLFLKIPKLKNENYNFHPITLRIISVTFQKL